MLFNKLGAVASIATLLATVSAADLPEIVIKGSKFFYSNNGTQFFMRGVAYQTDGTEQPDHGGPFVDPLANYETCSRDIPYLQKLRTNIIRVYALDGSKDHSKCMKALSDAGIYVVADLSQPKISINRDTPEWSAELYERYKSVVDEMQKYSNVLGFFAGNEVTNRVNNTNASAFVKAAIRDTKKYIKDKSYRKIPVGYSANDDEEFRKEISTYFACGSEEERADFYGFNVYSWCGNSNFQQSGYADRTDDFKDLNIPVFFSEYGCNKVRPRLFTDVGALYGDKMTGVWSGGIVYMYFEESNKYGLVSVDGDKVTTLPDFDNYASQIAKVNPKGVTSDSYTPSKTTVQCPSIGEHWEASTKLPPTPDKGSCKCMKDSLSCAASSKLEKEEYGAIFGFICGKDASLCKEIKADAKKGDYGAYSFCSAEQQLSYVLNQYYQANGKSADACDFKGSASLQKPTPAASCKAVIGSSNAASSHAGSKAASGADASKDNADGKETAGAQESSNAAPGAIDTTVSHFFNAFTTVLLVSLGFGYIFI